MPELGKYTVALDGAERPSYYYYRINVPTYQLTDAINLSLYTVPTSTYMIRHHRSIIYLIAPTHSNNTIY